MIKVINSINCICTVYKKLSILKIKYSLIYFILHQKVVEFQMKIHLKMQNANPSKSRNLFHDYLSKLNYTCNIYPIRTVFFQLIPDQRDRLNSNTVHNIKIISKKLC